MVPSKGPVQRILLGTLSQPAQKSAYDILQQLLFILFLCNLNQALSLYLKGEYNLFHGTLFDGKVKLPDCTEICDTEFRTTRQGSPTFPSFLSNNVLYPLRNVSKVIVQTPDHMILSKVNAFLSIFWKKFKGKKLFLRKIIVWIYFKAIYLFL